MTRHVANVGTGGDLSQREQQCLGGAPYQHACRNSLEGPCDEAARHEGFAGFSRKCAVAFCLQPCAALMNKWKYFVPVAVLCAGLLLLAGAPIYSIVTGIIVGGLLIWRSSRTPLALL